MPQKMRNCTTTIRDRKRPNQDLEGFQHLNKSHLCIPQIRVFEKETRKCFLVDVAVRGDNNIKVKENDIDLRIEIVTMGGSSDL